MTNPVQHKLLSVLAPVSVKAITRLCDDLVSAPVGSVRLPISEREKRSLSRTRLVE